MTSIEDKKLRKRILRALKAFRMARYSGTANIEFTKLMKGLQINLLELRRRRL